jgi:hypothetical protein
VHGSRSLKLSMMTAAIQGRGLIYGPKNPSAGGRIRATPPAIYIFRSNGTRRHRTSRLDRRLRTGSPHGKGVTVARNRQSDILVGD